MGLHHPLADDLELPAVLHALSDPQRLAIVRALAETDDARRCGSFGLPVSKSTLTHHFRVLRDAGVIDQREDGTARLNSLRRADLDRRFPGLLDAVLAADGHATGRQVGPGQAGSAKGGGGADERLTGPGGHRASRRATVPTVASAPIAEPLA